MINKMCRDSMYVKEQVDKLTNDDRRAKQALEF